MHRHKKILAVDDHPLNLTILEEILSSDYRVKTASNGREALTMAAEFKPGFILLDIMMPDSNGLDICRELRAMPGLHDSVIIIVSAKAMPAEQVAGIQAGANEYITKPFDEVELLSVLRRYYRNAQAETSSTVEQEPLLHEELSP